MTLNQIKRANQLLGACYQPNIDEDGNVNNNLSNDNVDMLFTTPTKDLKQSANSVRLDVIMAILEKGTYTEEGLSDWAKIEAAGTWTSDAQELIAMGVTID